MISHLIILKIPIIIIIITILWQPSQSVAFDADNHYFYYDKAFVLTNQHRPDAQLKFDLRNVNEVDVKYSKESTPYDLVNNQTRYKTTITLSTSESPKSKNSNNNRDKCDNDSPVELFNQTITLKPVREMYFSKYEFTWVRMRNSSRKDQEVCFYTAFNNADLYPTFTQKSNQHWPMDPSKTDTCSQSLTTGQFGPIVENLFLFTNGFAMVLNQTVPITIRRDFNKGYPMLCFGTSNQNSSTNIAIAFDIYIDYCDRWEGTCLELENDNLLLYRNVTQMYRNREQIPRKIPDERLFVDPIWTVWTNSTAMINQSEVLQFAWSLFAIHDFKSSLLEVDFNWQRYQGDLEFDSSRFPNPQKMFSKLRQLGQRLSLSVNPFISVNSSSYTKFKYTLARNQFGQNLALDDQDGLVDFSRIGVARWFEKRLTDLRAQIGFDSYNFDSGEVSLYEDSYALFANQSIKDYPNLLTSQYAESCAQFGELVQVASGYRSQNLPVLFKVDQTADWKELASFVPKVLTMSLGGYSFVVPNLIFGKTIPSEEMFIRWVQAITFMPVMKFTIPPWMYSQSTIELTRKFVDLHTEHSPRIIELASQSTQDGMPIIRPMWFVDPNDERTFKIDDQFMLGDEIMVAPVLSAGLDERQVYFPKGIWLDVRNNQSYQGPAFVTVDAPLEQLPYFRLFDRN